MWVTALDLRDFRSYERADLRLGRGLTVIHGDNGAGKTNLLEGLYFGCTGRSCRTTNEREVVRFGASVARVVVHASDGADEHELSVGFAPGQPKRLSADGAEVERLIDVEERPLVSVFLPDRLELIKGPPALRRGHLDQLVAGLWPLRAATRRAFGHALAHRNALLARARAGAGATSALDAWDAELARHAVELMTNRASAIERIDGSFVRLCGVLGLVGAPALRYRPRSHAASAEEFVAELHDRRAGELDRGFSAHGPHRDELLVARDGHDLRAFGSQGEQRVALLALLLAERAALGDVRARPPLMLLDDVMSELDGQRRALLAEELAQGGQSVITTTDLAHVPGAEGATVTRVRVAAGALHQEALAA